MSATNRITDVVQAYHDDGLNNRSSIDSAANDVLDELCEAWGLEYPDEATADKFAEMIAPLIDESVDWQQIADDDANAQEWDEARREAIYGGR